MEESNDQDNSNLNAYCTLRSSSSRNKNNNRLKKINQIGGSFRRIKNIVDNNSSNYDSENATCSYPYNQLDESLSESINNEKSIENISDHDQIATTNNDHNINDNNIDLINLNSSTTMENDNNQLLLKELNDNNLVPISKLIINDDRQSFSEFKRLNSYCTLRPDQKRKYLMKILSSAKNSTINNTSVTNCDNTCTNNNNSTNELLFSELDHVENCLLELDAYLEEIDSKSSDNALFDILPSPSSTAIPTITSTTTPHNNLSRSCYKNNNNNSSSVLSDINNTNTICHGDELKKTNNLVIRSNSNRLMTELRPELSWTINSTMPRDYKAAGHSSTSSSNTTITNSNNLSKNSHRNMLWRRDSMRKINPLILPDIVAPQHRRQSLTTRSTSTLIKDNDNNDEITNQMINESMHPLVTNSSSLITPSSSSSSSLRAITDEETASAILPIQNVSSDLVNLTINQNNNHNLSDDDDIGIEYLNLFAQEQLSQQHHQQQQQQLQHHEIECQNTDFVGNNNNEQCSSINNNNNLPRQMGRRAEGRIRIVSIITESDTTGNQRIIVNHDRPISAPPRAASRSAQHIQQQQQQQQQQQHQHQQQYNIPSEPSSVNTTRNTSPVSIISSSTSISSTAESVINNNSTDLQHRSHHFSVSHERPTISHPGHISSQSTTTAGINSTNNNNNNEQDETTYKEKLWPYSFSRILTATNCTLGLFNISRFSIFSIHFGANFIVQFLILSIIFGIPMLWLQMCLGFNLKRGPITMWRITPICKGIGIAILVCQAICAMYSAISIGWLLVYFRDSFVSRDSRYRWQEPFPIFRGGGGGGGSSNLVSGGQTMSVFATNDSIINLVETVADYFNGVVLQRYQLGPAGGISNGLGAVRFQLAFNLAVTWIIVFAILCEGVRSYGKIVFILMVLPLIGLVSLCTKMLTMINSSSLQNIFPSTDWQDFFINSQSWLSAAQEVFLTWVLLGASIISIFSKSMNLNEKKMVLRRDAIIVCFITLLGLIFSAILGNACVQILNDNGYFYFPGSFENLNSYGFLIPSNGPLPAQLISAPMKWLPRYSSLLGESYRRIDLNPNKESGFQPIRLVTELFPATLAAATQENIGAIWSVLGYLVFIAFGIGQLCAMWKPIAEALGNSMSGVLLSCVSGLLLAIPLASECGINIIHFLDYIFGGAWCLVLLWVCHIFAIFLIRGRPYTGDILVNDLQLTHTLAAFVALSWNVLLPIGLITLCILEYKMSGSRDLYHWRGKTYWSMWIRKIGGFLQIGCLMIIPITSAIQIYRYLSNGPPDILDRIQLLYRPPIPLPNDTNSMSNTRYTSDRIAAIDRSRNQLHATGGGVSIPATISIASNSNGGIIGGNNGDGNNNLQDGNNEDAPPKYTPPPSYTTATGARIAKMLRNSIRRSVRRIMGGESSNNNNRRQRANLANHQVLSMDTVISNLDVESLPPTYSSVLTDLSTQSTNIIMPLPLAAATTNTTSSVPQSAPSRLLFNSNIFRNNNPLKLQRRRSTNLRELSTSSAAAESIRQTSMLTMATTLPRNFSHNVMQTQQPTMNTLMFNSNNNNHIQEQQRRSSSFGGSVVLDQLELTSSSLQRQFLTRSDDNLVLNASPIGNSSIINLNSSDNDDDDNIIDRQTLTNTNTDAATGQIEINSI